MFALASSSFNCNNFTNQIWISNFTGTNLRSPQANIVFQPIQMESCTSEHFSRVPGIEERSQLLGLSNWKCLPLNKTYELEGSYELSSTYKAFQIVLKCNTSCGFNNCGFFKLYQLNMFMNPSNRENPFEYYISSNYLNYNNRDTKFYLGQLD